MTLSWNEVRIRASVFAKENADSHYEKGETQTFYNEFFEVFGVKRKRVAVYEKQVKKLDDKTGFIDLFWPGQLVIEQKSAGKNLEKANAQALDYCSTLKDKEFPRYILVCDFQTFRLYDLQEGKDWSFKLSELPEKVELFGFILGRETKTYSDQPAANIEAAELMGAVHDALEKSGYKGHDLEQFLVRLLFCLFADDTGIFEPKGIFESWLRDRTSEDGSGLGGQLAELFQVLDTPIKDRTTTLDEDLAQFPYVNGDLFKHPLRIPAFNSEMRNALIEASEFKWETVSPAIFGSLFQSVMNKDERRKLGAHYTSEKNILKVIGPLFLDELRVDLQRIVALKRGRTHELTAFHERLRKITVFDPACGCGNFLIIAYRELRALELQVLRELRKSSQLVLDATVFSKVDVDQFYGIEMEEFPARIAEVAMWMMDHIMNSKLGVEVGQVFTRIPLKKSPHILADNALQTDWAKFLHPDHCSYILGNPPFIGHQYRSKEQKEDMHRVWGRAGSVNRLDYVTCWFKLAADYAKVNPKIRIGLVSTNSITQGEQASILWPQLFKDGLSIFFAHRSFQWNSEARGTAAVHCVITGMTRGPVGDHQIFDYAHAKSDPQVSTVKRINGYLIDGPDYAVPRRSKPLPGMLKMHKGSQPTDGARVKKPNGGYVTYSNLILDEEQRQLFLATEPVGKKWLRPYVGGDELLSGIWRWCLWLKDVPASELKASKPLAERLERVRKGRLASDTASVRKMAKSPTLFTQDRQPDTKYLCVPEVSSEHREYVPWAMLPPTVIASNKLQLIVGGDMVYFAILSSAMHMAWMRTVAGRLESRYSYSPAVYYSFPWPDLDTTDRAKLTKLAQALIEVRKAKAPEPLSALYDPDYMPADLRKAHAALDTAVDRLYRRKAFASERERVEHLFELYESRVAPLATTFTKRKARVKALA
ncbi:N-6 DNA methylase [Mesorhizobium sp. LMG 17147]|uniref:class I SAM-dependent DNA methyltransferase n=1 Tax=Mesorhizobium sp. LMG 17147 TaxID=2963091 RepID=UPI0020C95D4F|nr:DNA methyltransferase [Mesorhizobium sp. LMG 17147]MCP9231430.1 N-6 DNA methylase [Mesorhizobium sp. LMG 17147]